MELVEQHGGNAVEAGVVENEAGEHALGDDLDAGTSGDLRAKANAIADGVAHPLAERLRHPLGRGACGEPPRFQHQDLLLRRPGLAGEHQWNPGGLAGARRCYQHGGIASRQSSREFPKNRVDRQRRPSDLGHPR